MLFCTLNDKYYEVSNEKLLEGIRYCLANITELVNISQKASMKFSDNSVALGLYTFAVEEFGKLVYLKEAYAEKKESYQIPKDIFVGRESHRIKFDKALEVLPTECIQPVYGIEVQTNLSSETVKIPVNPQGAEISIAGGITGTFTIVGDYPIDLLTRMACFYLDWDEKKKTWKTKPKVLADGLHRATNKLGLIVKAMSLKLENDSKESQKSL